MPKVPDHLKWTAVINGISVLKLPLLAFCTPKIVEISEAKSRVMIRLDWRTKNHLGVMYFGALAMGAELSIALKAIEGIQRSKKRIDFIFQDFEVKFLKRAEGHVHFICDEGAAVSRLVEQAATQSDRVSQTFTGYAIVPSVSDEPVMTYKLTLSMKDRSRKAT